MEIINNVEIDAQYRQCRIVSLLFCFWILLSFGPLKNRLNERCYRCSQTIQNAETTFINCRFCFYPWIKMWWRAWVQHFFENNTVCKFFLQKIYRSVRCIISSTVPLKPCLTDFVTSHVIDGGGKNLLNNSPRC